MYENRKFVIFSVTELDLVDFSQVLETSAQTVRKSVDETLTFVQYADRAELVQALSPIVAEEWGHFRKVLKEMDARGIKLDKKRRDDYVQGLLAFQRKGVGEDRVLLEKLLTCALIEARSCERFRLLSLECSEPALRSFYHEFMVSEAGHYRLFMDLAERYLPRDVVRQRWQEYLDYEAELLAGMEFSGDRVH